MTRYHILLVEDEPDVLSHNLRRLEAEGYRVTGACTLGEAKKTAAADPPDLVVLDILMPDGSGLDFCRDLRSVSSAPVIFLTNVTGKQQIIRGLRAGGDDYLEKPYDFDELLARIEAQLRRVSLLRRSGDRLEGGGLVLDLIRRRALLQGSELPLKPKEFQLLALLLRNKNRYCTAEELYTGVWGMAACDARTVSVHISNLRVTLKEQGGTLSIEHSRSRGYRLCFGDGGDRNSKF